jgi:hypothetical protein
VTDPRAIEARLYAFMRAFQDAVSAGQNERAASVADGIYQVNVKLHQARGLRAPGT